MSNTEYAESEPFTRGATRPFDSWRRHWVMGTLMIVLFGAIGVGAGFLLPVTWTAESRVAVGSGDLTSGAVAGFPLAASQLASNYARYVNNSGVAGNPVPGNVSLSASQIPDSNVIRIEASSTDPSAAQAAANDSAQKLMDAVNNIRTPTLEEVYADFTKAADDKAEADSAVAAAQHTVDDLINKDGSKKAIDAAREKVAAASAKAAKAGLISDSLRQKYTTMFAGSSTTTAKLLLVRTADTLSSNRVSLVTRSGLIGLAAGAVIGLLLAVGLDRRRLARVGATRGADDRPGE